MKQINTGIALVPFVFTLLIRCGYCMLSQSCSFGRSTWTSLAFLPSRKERVSFNIEKVPQNLAALMDESSEWLDKAAKLRREVQELEASSKRRSTEVPNTNVRPMEYTEVADSVWVLSYRFSDQPEPAEDDASGPRRRFYGGKLTVKFRRDGYTDLVSQEASGSATETCKLVKAWGWDIEMSKDNEKGGDEKEYLVFSIDVDLSSTTNHNQASLQRFYFQARQDKDPKTGALSFAEGTVTIKRDVVQNSTRWGFFSPAGILAQFRYVGDFIAKPVAIS